MNLLNLKLLVYMLNHVQKLNLLTICFYIMINFTLKFIFFYLFFFNFVYLLFEKNGDYSFLLFIFKNINKQKEHLF